MGNISEVVRGFFDKHGIACEKEPFDWLVNVHAGSGRAVITVYSRKSHPSTFASLITLDCATGRSRYLLETATGCFSRLQGPWASYEMDLRDYENPNRWERFSSSALPFRNPKKGLNRKKQAVLSVAGSKTKRMV